MKHIKYVVFLAALVTATLVSYTLGAMHVSNPITQAEQYGGKDSVLVEQKEKGFALVYLPVRLESDLQSVEGITRFEKINKCCWLIELDPRYNPEDIVKQIENLGARND